MDWSELVIRLLVAAAAGMVIGIEREWREKAAGFRTLTLVSTGSALFVLSAVYANPTEGVRMMAGVAAGVGFLGAGTIRYSNGEVLGLTTAACVWISAALGATAALGQYRFLLAGVVISIVVLSLLSLVPFERVRHESHVYTLKWRKDSPLERVVSPDPFHGRGLSAFLVSVAATGTDMVASWRVMGERSVHMKALEDLALDGEILEFELRE